MLRRLLRAPALHFLVSGACLFALTRAEPAPPPLELDAARVRAVFESWTAANGAAPDARERAALMQAAIDDELLLREAYARGLGESDPVVRARLARNARFLGAGTPGASEEELADATRELGLARGDLVVRRRLIERMRAELEAAAEPPSEAEIAARFARDAARYRAPARVRLAHVFATDPGRAAELARALEREHVAPGLGAFARGDAFLLGHELAPRSQAELARDFGTDFAVAAFALPEGHWSEPIGSSYGTHVVFVREHVADAPLALPEAHARVAAELRAERAATALRAGLDRLRARQPIRVAELAP